MLWSDPISAERLPKFITCRKKLISDPPGWLCVLFTYAAPHAGNMGEVFQFSEIRNVLKFVNAVEFGNLKLKSSLDIHI